MFEEMDLSSVYLVEYFEFSSDMETCEAQKSPPQRFTALVEFSNI